MKSQIYCPFYISQLEPISAIFQSVNNLEEVREKERERDIKEKKVLRPS